jgi:hypothetical protein
MRHSLAIAALVSMVQAGCSQQQTAQMQAPAAAAAPAPAMAAAQPATTAPATTRAARVRPPYVPIPHERLILVTSPVYGADIKGDTTIDIVAPAFTQVTVKCWKQGAGFGSDSTIGQVALDAQGKGSIVFPADGYPHGPITVRIAGQTAQSKDNCYLQLYNTGGVSWNEGMPKDPPPAAAGMALVFADDFDGPLSISSVDPKATYYDHKPPNGSTDFGRTKFRGFHDPNNPFFQVDTYLRIRADQNKNSAGLISSLKNDANGVAVRIPCYFECRFLGPNAVGTWPAFWLMTDYMTDYVKTGHEPPCDELDIIEAYGGEGPMTPNAGDTYRITPHAWPRTDVARQPAARAAVQQVHNPIHMAKFAIPSTWWETFHTYGCKVTDTDTIYYCDNIEVARHATLEVSKKYPIFFMINLATSGGWPVDLSRYDGRADMYVDYVRVYQGGN